MSPPDQNEDAPDDASIPVLTERLTLPPLELDTTLPQETGPPAAAPAGAGLALDITLPPAPGPLGRAAPPHPAPAPAPVPAAPAPAPAPAAARAPAPITLPAADAGAVTAGSHWTRIELELRSSILQAIADALPQQIDQIVRGRMNEALERLVTQLGAETRLAVAASLREIVDQAVRTELARLRSLKR
jgi:hypothetical protein